MSSDRERILLAAFSLLPVTLLVIYSLSVVTHSAGTLPFAMAIFSFGVAGEVSFFVVPSVLFLLFAYAMWSGRGQVPLSSIIVFIAIAAFSCWYFASAWPYALEYQGEFVALLLLSISIATALVLTYTIVRNRRKPTVGSAMFFHWLLVAWIATVAFPYFGEVP